MDPQAQVLAPYLLAEWWGGGLLVLLRQGITMEPRLASKLRFQCWHCRCAKPCPALSVYSFSLFYNKLDIFMWLSVVGAGTRNEKAEI